MEELKSKANNPCAKKKSSSNPHYYFKKSSCSSNVPSSADVIDTKPKPRFVESYKNFLKKKDKELNSFKKDLIEQHGKRMNEIGENFQKYIKKIDDSLDILTNAKSSLVDLDKLKNNNKELYEALSYSGKEAINTIKQDIVEVSDSTNVISLIYSENTLEAWNRNVTALENSIGETQNIIKASELVVIDTFDAKFKEMETMSFKILEKCNTMDEKLDTHQSFSGKQAKTSKKLLLVFFCVFCCVFCGIAFIYKSDPYLIRNANAQSL